MTLSQDCDENNESTPRRARDFGHLGHWPSECDSYDVGHPTKTVKRRRGQFQCGNKKASH